MQHFTRFQLTVGSRELHGDGDDGTTAVMGLNFMRNTTVIAGMGTAFTVVPRERDGAHVKAAVAVTDCSIYYERVRMKM